MAGKTIERYFPIRPIETSPPNGNPIGINDENDRLTKTVIWGPPGIESFLAQPYDNCVSLFLDRMDVLQARKEADIFNRTLNALGVQTFLARDLLSQKIQIDQFPLRTKDDVLQALNIKAIRILIEYGHLKTDILNGGKSKIELYHDFDSIIDQLLEEDIKRYGLDKALILNQLFSLSLDLPPGNLIYARDQMNVILSRLIIAAMAKPIREPEVELYKHVYEDFIDLHEAIVINPKPDEQLYNELNCQLALEKPIALPKKESFEGGDLYIHNKTVYIGVGARTTIGAAIQIYNAVKDLQETKGYKFALVFDENIASRSEKDNMDFMHLDTWSYPLGFNGNGRPEMEIYRQEAQRKTVILLETNEQKQLVVNNTHMTYDNYLENQGYSLHEIPLEEQQMFGCNNLYIGRIFDKEFYTMVESVCFYNGMDVEVDIPIERYQMRGIPETRVYRPIGNDQFADVVIVPVGTNKETVNELLRAGNTLVFTPLSESTKGYGAAHCMNGQLRREPPEIVYNRFIYQ